MMCIYQSLLMLIACICGAYMVFLAGTKLKKEILLFFSIGILLSIIIDRLIYVISRLDYYSATNFHQALDFITNSFSLEGLLLGFGISSIVINKINHINWQETLNRILPAFPLMVAFMRLSEYLAGEGIGEVVRLSFFQRFPFSICNEFGEWRWAVFLWESLYAFVIWYWLISWQRTERLHWFLILIFLGQVFFESMRCDNYTRILFIHLSQVSALCFLMIILVYRLIRVKDRIGPIRLVVFLSGMLIIIFGEYLIVKSGISNGLLHIFVFAGTLLLLISFLIEKNRGGRIQT